jgi:hypothetical protein
VDKLKIASNLANVGDAKTVCALIFRYVLHDISILTPLARHPPILYDPFAAHRRGEGVFRYSA